MNKFIVNIFLYFFGVLVFFSCSSVTDNQKQEEADFVSHQSSENFLTGKLIEKVFCKNDSSQSYSLYLPSTYSSIKKYPVLFFFDPHADGKLPLLKYQSLAERYGFIFVGSNNSKNGLQRKQSDAIVRTFIIDVLNRVRADSSKIFVAGFSGGARVAGMAPIQYGIISGAIGCSAGMSSQSNQIYPPFVGIAGEEDMNYLEMVINDEQMKKKKVPHLLLTFEGKHEWSPENSFEEALLFLLLNNMKEKKISTDTMVVNRFIAMSDSVISECKKQKNIINEYLGLVIKTECLAGLIDVSVEEKKIADFLQNKQFLMAVEKKQKLLQQEYFLQQNFRNLFDSLDINSISVELKKLEHPKNEDERKMFVRVKGYLSLLSYSYSSRLIDQTEQEMVTEKILSIYKLVDPKNSEHAYLSACLSAKKGNQKKAITFLLEAVSLGFSDVNRLENDNYFLSMKTDTEFKNLCDKIRVKK
ncbi:MAG: hypothetical protein V1781_01845 [Bacteroidota bacterium]